MCVSKLQTNFRGSTLHRLHFVFTSSSLRMSVKECLACAVTLSFSAKNYSSETSALPKVGSTSLPSVECTCLLNEKNVVRILDVYTRPVFSKPEVEPNSEGDAGAYELTPLIVKILTRGNEDVLIPKTVKGVMSSVGEVEDATKRLLLRQSSDLKKCLVALAEFISSSRGKSSHRENLLHVGCGDMSSTVAVAEILGTTPRGIDFLDRYSRVRSEVPVPKKSSSSSASSSATRWGPRLSDPVYEWVATNTVPRVATAAGGGKTKMSLLFPNSYGILPPTEPLSATKSASDVETFSVGLLPTPAVNLESFFAEAKPESFSVLLFTDILHHVQDFCGLMKWATVVLRQDGYLAIQDSDCRSWSDAYQLDVQHRCFAETQTETLATAFSTSDFQSYRAEHGGLAEGQSYLPVYAYAKREFWRNFLTMRGFELVKSIENPMTTEYRSYCDLFQKKSVNTHGSEGPWTEIFPFAMKV